MKKETAVRRSAGLAHPSIETQLVGAVEGSELPHNTLDHIGIEQRLELTHADYVGSPLPMGV